VSLSKEGNLDPDTQRSKIACEDEGRDWDEVSIYYRMLETAGSYQKVGRGLEQSVLKYSQGTNPANPLVF
jgi:hypothetical protein